MIKIVFVCLGNICRSPMAEAIMKELVFESEIKEEFFIDSKATSTEELGNPIYPLAKKKLEEKGILYFSHDAQVFRKEDYDFYRKSIPNYDIDDPWYTRNFEKAYNDIYNGCQKLLKELMKQKKTKREGE